MATTCVHRLALSLVFPAGVAPGAGKEAGNRLALARNGRGEAVLRGSAVAGALRHAWQATSRRRSEADVQRWFGHAAEGETGVDRPSPLRVCDMRLETGHARELLRHHNATDRHTGAVRPEGLFTLEALPPGTTGHALLDLHLDATEDDEAALTFLRELVGLLAAGVVLGGHAARGLGHVRLVGPARHRRFDLGTLDGLAAWLDESWRQRDLGGEQDAVDGMPFEGTPPEQVLVVDFTLAVPRGQDLCIGEGTGCDHEIEPQRVHCADGTLRWRLPGSSLRGVMRTWVTRLAARDGRSVADSAQRYLDRGRPATGDELGWGFDDERTRLKKLDALAQTPESLDTLVPCPLMRLFGSLYSASRIHVADALSRAARDVRSGRDVQTRRHVAVDRITGGASEGFLFDHQALLEGVFDVRLTVQAPSADEARWLAQTLRAIDYGLIRLGSSKSAGRLALAGPVRATGPQHQAFTALASEEALR